MVDEKPVQGDDEVLEPQVDLVAHVLYDFHFALGTRVLHEGVGMACVNKLILLPVHNNRRV